MPSSAYDAVLWDFGGVILTSPFEAFNELEAARGLPRDSIRRINARNPDGNAWARFERSEIDLDGFDAAFAAEAAAQGLELRGRDVVAVIHGRIRPEMVEALRRVKRHYKTACLTNNVNDLGAGPAYAAAVGAVMAEFGAVIESRKVGVRKPDPQFYRLACEILAIDPARAVYLDDLGINLKPAAAMGMRTIKVTGAEQALAELEAVLGLELR
ncbi:HAD-IA family hydrolase [Zavarzinia compransoris]|uniref:HAD family hydrolase n=1 Tax=Zavarzinia compransoris TaxID=1264899 RepID=A0A317DVR0_9PROT|nr:HAD-IA family hydrolase [Zavarzinia compransoris]PWR18768.1 HAD family hydrolase [Zavarzinia compransoris]TDP48752.1 putative hydrolase of the HAD superfamily [Zavarzinia compransoris]